MQDLKVEYDGTVRNSDKNIIQFKFGDDGIDAIKPSGSPTSITEEIAQKPVEVEKKNTDSAALKLIKGLKEELEPMSTKEFIANSRSRGRRRLVF